MRNLGIPREKLYVHGGACALGHPIGAPGARILSTLIAAMIRGSARRGLASICIGGGEVLARAIARD
jgi:acetyl-CoA C-acetyltransferase